MKNVQQGSRSVDFRNPPKQIVEEEETPLCKYCFGCWIVAMHEFCKSIKQKFNNWLIIKSYKRSLYEYNISDVLEAVSGEDNKLGQGHYGRVDRYQMAGEDNQPLEIAYKIPDISEALKNPDEARAGETKLMQTAQIILENEKQILNALSHPNIIKPVSSKNGSAENSTVIMTRAFSEEEKLSLKQDIPPDDNTPDFDFEIIESITTEAPGIALPLADTTLRAHLSEQSLTVAQKDRAIRALIAAVAHMHKVGYVHLDIKPDNILRKGDEWLLSDFGTGLHFSELYNGSNDRMPLIVNNGYGVHIRFGTLKYTSPQILARFHLTTYADHATQLDVVRQLLQPGSKTPPFDTDARDADAFSLGIVLFEILTGVNPTPDLNFFGNKPREIFPDLFQAHVNMLLEKHRGTIGDYYEIVAGLLKSDCRQRMTVHEAEGRLAWIAQPD